ncbi:hypothetical protein [Streptomyces sp. OR43]|uniref:hypothetical protein n=1 Tax=Streptomyces sp. or43 TaxID=2478957 RepID=UPI0011CD8E16|nr:hypothetical protein [Streptomyces sp. or43]TXS36450.1 hypothetical protein EAO72_23445 [Streptomyces sp. or43]
MPRTAHIAAALALGALALTACSGNTGAATLETDRAASVPEAPGSDEPLIDFMKLSLELTAGCPPLDDSKTDKPLGPSDVPTLAQGPSGEPADKPGDLLPLPADPPATDEPAASVPDGNLLEPVPLTEPEVCYAEKFAAHVTTALKGTGENAAEVRTALNRAGYPNELIVAMKPENGAPRVRMDLREWDTRVALQVVHRGARGTVVDKFGAQPGAPLAAVRYTPGR